MSQISERGRNCLKCGDYLPNGTCSRCDSSQQQRHCVFCKHVFTPLGLGNQCPKCNGPTTPWIAPGEPKPETKLVDPQPPPKTAATPAVWSLVMRDMAERDITGAAKYGVRLQPNNGRDALVDAFQEALDLCVYLRQAIFERDGK